MFDYNPNVSNTSAYDTVTPICSENYQKTYIQTYKLFGTFFTNIAKFFMMK